MITTLQVAAAVISASVQNDGDRGWTSFTLLLVELNIIVWVGYFSDRNAGNAVKELQVRLLQDQHDHHCLEDFLATPFVCLDFEDDIMRQTLGRSLRCLTFDLDCRSSARPSPSSRGMASGRPSLSANSYLEM